MHANAGESYHLCAQTALKEAKRSFFPFQQKIAFGYARKRWRKLSFRHIYTRLNKRCKKLLVVQKKFSAKT